MSTFEAGQKAICINDNPGWISKKKLLMKDNIYEVIRIASNGDIEVEGVSGLWDKSRFRKLIDDWVEGILNEVVQEIKQDKILINHEQHN